MCYILKDSQLINQEKSPPLDLVIPMKVCGTSANINPLYIKNVWHIVYIL